MMRLGTCWYPEQWPEEWWADDVERMAAMGLSRVRVGEFAWSRIEPQRDRFDWGWLDRAIDLLGHHGLGVILGTPTATPPRWLLADMPDMIALDETGAPRRFGSRRHYCFSHPGYRREARRITTHLVERYGAHPAIVSWQIDNEFGCHDTAISYSAAAAEAFRRWLERRYGTIAALNEAWGNAFWSMDYPGFDDVDPPNLTVTEPNPAHVLAWRRFSSDQVVDFGRVQAEVIRAGSPGRNVTHNFMGFFTQFDHHAVAEHLDSVGWDSYPLGFLEQFPFFDESEKRRYARQGHPDIAAFHHDLYRGCAKNGRWSVLEQQPGPVNWARFNPAPLAGMVRLWSLEALAHGAELVSYFRWRQARHAQEQMHAGLLRPDREDDIAAEEIRQTASDIASLPPLAAATSRVALVFTYEASWVIETQPHGASFSFLGLAFAMYRALRALGLDVDIIGRAEQIADYDMVVVPTLPIVQDDWSDALFNFRGPLMLGPRTGSRGAEFELPLNLPPGRLADLAGVKVRRVESLRDGLAIECACGSIQRWFEEVAGVASIEIATAEGKGAVLRQGDVRYLAGWADDTLLKSIFGVMAAEAGISTIELPAGLRLRRRGPLMFAFNYDAAAVDLGDHLPEADTLAFVLGSRRIEAAGVTAWYAP